MMDAALEHEVTLWMTDDIPARMYFAGRRWRISDTPTRLRESIWAVSEQGPGGLYGWRFQATDEAGETFVFDVFRGQDSWHVHHAYS